MGALTVLETDELMLTTNKGKLVRTRVSEIREAGRNTMGVKLIDLARNEKLQDIAKVISQGDDEETPTTPPPETGGSASEPDEEPPGEEPTSEE